MKNYISAADWAKLEEALMEAQIPFHISFDSHINPDMTSITYDKYIRVEPFVLQVHKEVNVDAS